MRTRHTMTVSLPPAMIREVEAVRKAEHRTRSELIREALRTYFTMRRTYTPTAVTVDDLGSSLDTAGKQARAKKRPARATA